MKPIRLTYRSLWLCVLAAMVTGCGASPIPLRATTTLPGAVRAASQPSWFEPQAGKIKKLLYVSDEDSGVVHVYNYATAAEVARLTEQIRQDERKLSAETARLHDLQT